MTVGSNQGKQPHESDRGAGAWSRDERRANRKVMRKERGKQSIEDSAASNDDDNTPDYVAGDLADQETVIRNRRLRRNKRRKFCRKEGTEHDFVLVHISKRGFTALGLGGLMLFKCQRCGKQETRWEKPQQ